MRSNFDQFCLIADRAKKATADLWNAVNELYREEDSSVSQSIIEGVLLLIRPDYDVEDVKNKVLVALKWSGRYNDIAMTTDTNATAETSDEHI